MCGRLMTGIGFTLAFASTVHGAELVGKPRVIDGNTIEIAGERIRLHGIDAPEAKQTCAAAGRVCRRWQGVGVWVGGYRRSDS